MSDIEALTVEQGAPDVPTDKTTMIATMVTIVSAYVANNSLPAAELPSFIKLIYGELGAVGTPQRQAIGVGPAVPIHRSVSRDYIVCLEDGHKFQTMRRHLSSKYNLTPDQYRAKWGLPKNYPMTAPAYSEARSMLAKAVGLGVARGVTANKTAEVRAR